MEAKSVFRKNFEFEFDRSISFWHTSKEKKNFWKKHCDTTADSRERGIAWNIYTYS